MDLSPFAVARARERLPAASIAHGDAQRMPWPDDSFDVVLASHLFGHVPPAVRDRITAEALRVLTSNGQLLAVDHRWHDAGLPGFIRLREWTSGAGMVRIACHVPAATVSVAK
jgi:ubiquinone/menaquinone biosynthesis C-methylase UbiE